MKNHVRYNVAIIVCAVLTVLFAVLAVVSLIPKRTSLGIEVKETIRVSSSLDGDSKGYRSQLRGVIVNRSDESVHIERLELVVGNGKDEKVVVLRDIKLSPRVIYDLQSHENFEWEDDAVYDRVISVTVVSGDVRDQLSNNTAGLTFRLITLFWCVLALVGGFLLVRFSKMRYYLAQEDKMRQN